MNASSLVAFGLVFLLASLALSTLLALVHGALRTRLEGLGPWAERRAAALTIALPPILSLGLVLVLAVDSAIALQRGTDHCLDHGHHRHVCVQHGAAWASETWALVLLGSVLLWMAIRAGRIAWAHLQAQRSVTFLRRSAAAIPGEPGCWLIPLDRPVAFTAGVLRPAVIVSRGAWDRLDAAERRALLAHERAHIAHGDLGLRALLGWTACLSAPGLARHVLRRWEAAAEKACDRRAAAAVGQPSVVASALVLMARGGAPHVAPAAAVFAADSHVVERVGALLATSAREGKGPATRLVRTAWGLVALLLILGASFAAPLHHLIETILG
jgi:Zn-dependent protease with chaperone function